MADASIEMQKELLSTLEKINSTISNNNDLLTKAKDMTGKMQGNYDKMVDSYDDISKSQKGWNKDLSAGEKILKSIEAIGRTLKNLFLSIFAGINLVGFIKGILEINKNLRDTAFRMGLGAKGLGQLQTAYQGVTQATGMSVEKSSALISNLARYTNSAKDIQKLGIAAAYFSRVTGVSDESAARLNGNLQRMGKLGADQIGRVNLAMMKVQRVAGLTEAEMEQLTETTTKTTMLLSQMGKSANDIERFSKGTTKLAGAFRSVGVNAEEATKFVEDLLDPTKVEDNALLYSKLGISMQDAFAGNVDPGKLAGKFKSLGAEMKNMNPAAAGEMAKSLGMSLGTLRQFENIDESKFADAMDAAGGDWQKAMAKMQGEQTGPLEKLQQLGNKLMAKLAPFIDKIEAAIGKLIPVLVNIIEKGANFLEKVLQPAMKFLSDPKMWILVGIAILGIFILLKTKTKLFAKDLGEQISDGIKGGLAMGYEKGAKIAEEKSGKYERAMNEDRKKRIMETYDFQIKQAESFILKQEQMNNKYFKGVMAWGARMVDVASYGGKPTSILISQTEGLNKKIQERVKMSEVENRNIIEARKNKQEILTKERDMLAVRINQIKEEQTLYPDNKNPRLTSELIQLEKRNKLLQKGIDKQTTAITSATDAGKARSASLLKFASADDIAMMQKAVQEEVRLSNERTNALKIADAQNIEQQSILEKVRAQLAIDQGIIKEKIMSGKFTTEEADRLDIINAKLKESESLDMKLKQERESISEQMRTEVDLMGTLAKEQKSLGTAAGDRKGDADRLKKYESFIYRARDAVSAVTRNIGSSITKGAQDLVKGAKAAASSLIQGVKSMPGYLKALGGNGPLGMVKGVGAFLTGKRVDKTTGSIVQKQKKGGAGGAIAGGVGGLLIGFLMRLEPVQKMIQKLMEKLQAPLNSLGSTLEPLMDQLLPIFETVGLMIGNLMRQLMPALMPLIKALIDAVMPILTAILPPLKKILLALLPAIKPLLDGLLNILIKYALPIMLKILGAVLLILGGIFKGIGKIVGIFIKDDPISKMGDEFMKAGLDLWAGKKESDDNLTSAIEDNTKVTEKKDKAAVISANGKSFIQTSAASVTSDDKMVANTEKQTQIQVEQKEVIQQGTEAQTLNVKVSGDMLKSLKNIEKLLSQGLTPKDLQQ